MKRALGPLTFANVFLALMFITSALLTIVGTLSLFVWDKGGGSTASYAGFVGGLTLFGLSIGVGLGKHKGLASRPEVITEDVVVEDSNGFNHASAIAGKKSITLDRMSRLLSRLDLLAVTILFVLGLLTFVGGNWIAGTSFTLIGVAMWLHRPRFLRALHRASDRSQRITR